MSGARCRFVYGPADPIAIHCLLLQEIQIGFGFTFLVPAHQGRSGQNPEGCKIVVVVVRKKQIVLICSLSGDQNYLEPS